MAYREEDMEILENIEAVIVAVYRHNPKMIDFTVMNALDAAIKHYRAEEHGSQERIAELSQSEEEVYKAIRGVCDWRLGFSTELDFPELDVTETPERIIYCLKTLQGSVKKAGREGDRQGYLKFISRFL
ncbi:MAG TPA: hypothetical protein VHO03_08330 [Ignavibacteriales bacterium]|nr:hypothetical protein [Ignavibacteriales bacterium]